MYTHSYDASDPAEPHVFTHSTTGNVVRCPEGYEALLEMELNRNTSTDQVEPSVDWQIPYARDFGESLWPEGNYDQK